MHDGSWLKDLLMMNNSSTENGSLNLINKDSDINSFSSFLLLSHFICMLLYAEHFTFSPTSKDVCVLVCGMPAAETIMLALW